MRCVLHHMDPNDRTKMKDLGWQYKVHEPVFEDEREELSMMPRQRWSYTLRTKPEFKEDVEKFVQWREETYNKVYHSS